MTKKNIIAQVIDFARDFDPYEFADTVDDIADFIDYTASELNDGVRAWLQSIVDDEEDYDGTARKLIAAIDATC